MFFHLWYSYAILVYHKSIQDNPTNREILHLTKLKTPLRFYNRKVIKLECESKKLRTSFDRTQQGP